MIRLFFIKNKLKNKNLMSNNDEKILEKYKKIAQKEKQEIIQELKTNIEKGLTNKEAEQKIATTAPIIPKIPTNCLIIIFSLS